MSLLATTNVASTELSAQIIHLAGGFVAIYGNDASTKVECTPEENAVLLGITDKSLIVNERPDGKPFDPSSQKHALLRPTGDTPFEKFLLAQPTGWWNRLPSKLGVVGWRLNAVAKLQPPATAEEALARLSAAPQLTQRPRRPKARL